MRTIHKVVLPSCGASMNLNKNKRFSGSGIGAVLLDGGIGGQSSYSSLDDYINTTGVNPLAQNISKQIDTTGRGLKSMNQQLEKLLIKSNKGRTNKEKNINFNL